MRSVVVDCGCSTAARGTWQHTSHGTQSLLVLCEFMGGLGALEALDIHWFRVVTGSKAVVVRMVVPCLAANLGRHFVCDSLRLELLKGATPWWELSLWLVGTGGGSRQRVRGGVAVGASGGVAKGGCGGCHVECALRRGFGWSSGVGLGAGVCGLRCVALLVGLGFVCSCGHVCGAPGGVMGWAACGPV